MFLPTLWILLAATTVGSLAAAGPIEPPAGADDAPAPQGQRDARPRTPPAIWAAQHFDFETLERWIAHGIDVDARDERGQTALFYASGPAGTRPGEAVRIAYLLVQAGTDVNARDADQRTPLMHAARFGHAGTAAHLVATGADPGAADKDGWTPLMYAVTGGDFLFVRRGIREVSGGEQRGEALFALHVLAYINASFSVETLLQAGADPNARSRDGWTPLLLAAHVGWYDHEREFPEETRLTEQEAAAIERGGEVAAFGRKSCPADLVQRLLARGADPNARSPSGRTALDIARRRDDEGGRRLVAVLERVTAPDDM